jgi:hypothetical protein
MKRCADEAGSRGRRRHLARMWRPGRQIGSTRDMCRPGRRSSSESVFNSAPVGLSPITPPPPHMIEHGPAVAHDRPAHASEKGGDGIRTHEKRICNPPVDSGSGNEQESYGNSAFEPAYFPDSSSPGLIDDPDLWSVVNAWSLLAEPIRRAVMALVGSVAPDTTTKTPPDALEARGFGRGSICAPAARPSGTCQGEEM